MEWWMVATLSIKAGDNRMTIFVTNTLINRISGMERALPVPDHLVSQYGSGTTDYARGRQKTIEMDFQPLPPSGLMGPVKIKVLKEVAITLN